MLLHITQHHLLMLNGGETSLPRIGCLFAGGLVNPSREGVAAASGSTVCLYQPCFSKGFQGALGGDGVTLDMLGQLVCRYPFGRAQSCQGNQAIDGELCPSPSLLLKDLLAEVQIGRRGWQT
ncbi:hypothetical protein D3C80_1224450 [compost metagenome]